MDATVGRETDVVAFLAGLAEAPYRYDFYQTLRRLECLHPQVPRWGLARRPADEPVRCGQEPHLSFPPAPIAAFGGDGRSARPRLDVRLFGLLGPNGPLPIHLTEYARERVRHAGDPTLARFLDMLQHRLILLFYRAWAQAQPHVNHDRPDEDRFRTYLGALVGLAPPAFRDRDAVPDLAKLFQAGHLVRQTRNAEGLVAILRHYFRVPVAVQEFVGHWLTLSRRDRTTLRRHAPPLGGGAVLGGRVWDRQSKVRVRMGPLTLRGYEALLPGGTALREVVDWVRGYVGFELAWDLCLVLRRADVPRLVLGRQGRLGWTTWLGHRRTEADADELRLDAEAFVAFDTKFGKRGARPAVTQAPADALEMS